MDDADEATLSRLASALSDADTAAALTGAGISAPSGVPTFRGEEGVWGTEFDPMDFRIGRFRRDPEGFWRDRLDLHDRLFPDGVEPNSAHEALASLEAAGLLDAVVTQNTDGLHAAAGSETVLELHGNAARVACVDCGATRPAEPVHERVRAAVEGEDGTDRELPPTCPDCGGVLKPDVVLFGESLPRRTFRRARDLAADSDVFLAIGSSLEVEPAASLPRRAAAGGTLAVVNLDSTAADKRADIRFRADVTDVLPALAARLDVR
ncbi:Sir2 family NAD-dependent protein deacetylase [Halobaculum sp. EA56]|uniref:Sir2 family NAD-dependent protein deacetylase n=1 Tax=Halobaculum sp. EA56 TaxID=3421648 RepID=UPI003EBACDB2